MEYSLLLSDTIIQSGVMQKQWTLVTKMWITVSGMLQVQKTIKTTDKHCQGHVIIDIMVA